jgi:hypothetical protein
MPTFTPPPLNQFNPVSATTVYENFGAPGNHAGCKEGRQFLSRWYTIQLARAVPRNLESTGRLLYLRFHLPPTAESAFSCNYVLRVGEVRLGCTG